MNSLLQKENMAGKIQMVFVDPPYGINYKSNFQPFSNKRDVKDDELIQEVEMVKAFRGTWELGIHSYLSYLRDRFLLAKELLSDSGSIFVQISEENVHRVRIVLDEIFGAENFVGQISFQKTGGQTSKTIGRNNDYLLWFAKNKEDIKYNQLYFPKAKDIQEMFSAGFKNIDIDGEVYNIASLSKKYNVDYNNKEQIFIDFPQAKCFRVDPLQSGGIRKNQSLPYIFQGTMFKPKEGNCWKTTVQLDEKDIQNGKIPGMIVLEEKNRLITRGSDLYYKKIFDDFEYKDIYNVWTDTGGASNPIYVVQTSEKVLQRCILMSTATQAI